MRLVSGTQTEMPEAAALVVTVVSIAGKLLLAWTQHLFGKKAGSAMLMANAKNMAADVFVSAGVLAGLVLSIAFNLAWADSVTALLVGIWIVKSSIGIFLEINVELMDGSTGPEPYRAVFEAVLSVDGVCNPHRARMRRIAGFWDIDIDIEVDPNLTVREAHRIASAVEIAIRESLEGVYDIMVHVEPAGVGRHGDEGYGLSERDVEKRQ
jgi:cation diffusion facilitator family transporter